MITADAALLAAAASLRHDVFVTEQGVDPVVEADGADSDAVHSVVERDGAVVAAGRLVVQGETARLGRIAVRADWRGSGLGAGVVRDLEGAAAAAGLHRLRLHAQEPVVGFYERIGWQAVGEPDVEAGIAHRWMERDLLPGLRPVRDGDAVEVQRLIGGCFAEFPGCVLDLPGIDHWMLAPATSYAAKGGQLWVLPDPDGLRASVGWAPAGAAAGEGVELKSLYVGSRHRRQGFAAALVGVVERVARQRGASRVELWSDSRFTDAHRLYTRLGYRRQPRTRRLDDPSDTTEYAFHKQL